MMKFHEFNIKEFEQSTISAFPDTTRRQHVTESIKIKGLNFLPFFGVKTLLVRAEADNRADNGGVYNPLILFKNVVYHEEVGKGRVLLKEVTGKPFVTTTLQGNDILVRCQCKDFFWRFNHFDHLENSLYGANRKPYTSMGVGPEANPSEAFGYCKHLFKLAEKLKEIGLVF